MPKVNCRVKIVLNIISSSTLTKKILAMKKLLITTCLLLLIAETASAQFGNLLGKAAERAAQRKLEQAVEKETEKAIDKAVDKATSKSDKDKAKDKKVSVEQDGDKTIINTDESEVTIEKDNSTVALDVKPSTFIGSYTQTIKITENGKDTEKPMQMTMYYDTYKTAMEMNQLDDREAGTERIIFDRQYRTMTTLSIDKKGQKEGMTMKMPKIAVKTKKEAEPQQNSDFNIVRTNETRSINGYTCNKYTGQSKDGNMILWVAESIDFDPALMSEATMGKSKNEKWANGIKKGFVMEMQSKDTKNKEEITMTITNLKVGSVDKSKFSTDGYKMETMPDMPFFRDK